MGERRRQRRALGLPVTPRITTVERLERELSRMAGRQVIKILGALHSRRAVEQKVAELVSKRRARRKARLQQKASRKRNRR